MTAPVISAYPAAPQRTDLPAIFSTKADTFVASMEPRRVEMNALGTWMNDTAVTVTSNATTASNAATTATTQAGIATTQASNAATSASNAATLIVRYQGALSADPSVNKTGGALVAGDWYINSTTGFIRAYTGSAWVNGVTAGVTSLNGSTGALTGFTENTAAQTLTNKTLTTPILSATASGTTAGRLGYLSGALTYGTGSTQRTIVNLDEAQTLTNKTLTTPILSATASGTTAGRLGYSSGLVTYGDGILTKTFVNTDTVQTLTNKDVRKIQIEISTPTTAISGNTYVFLANTTLTLPLSPTIGMTVEFANRSGVNTPVINRNGQRIMGLEENMVLNDKNAFGQLMYNSVARGWILV